MNLTPKAIALFFLTGGGVAIFLMAAQHWVQMEVAAQLANAGIVPASHIAAIEEDVQDNTDDIVRERDRIERIAQILMED